MNANEKIVILGGSSGMGLEVARRMLAEGASVVIVGRSQERLDAACRGLGDADALSAIAGDIGDKAQMMEAFEHIGTLSHLIVTAADLAYGPFRTLTEADMERTFRSKVMGPLFAAQAAVDRMPKDGSITFTAGVAAHRPMPGGALPASANGALEAMVRALALELAPLRVNAVSPGWVDTPIWGGMMSLEDKAARFAAMAAKLPAGRVGQPSDIAEAFSFLLSSSFVTGTVVHVEGGQLLV